MREFCAEMIEPFIDEWEEAKQIPESLYKEMATRGYLAGLMGSAKFPTEYTNNRVKSVPPERWDVFHELILTDELSRVGSGGLVWFLIGGIGIGCPPVLHFGNEALKQKVLPGILNGDKRICLAITEPGKLTAKIPL
jgi:alkylation response protein AidB-like acyl-CoA dehydrogenase